MLVGAGDIGVCGTDGPHRTAALLDTIGGIVFTAGDNAYPDGTRDDFLNCYDPSWGRHRSRTRPSPGNHDYETPGASGYFDYFGPNAGPPGRGYYSFMAGAWLVVSLNSNVASGAGSAQLAWLRQELQSQRAACVAAIWHHPFASSGPHGSDPRMRDVWRTLMEFNADVVINGHDHVYERFTTIDADGFPSAAGMRAFVAGTGGAAPYAFGPPRPGSESRGAAWGVLKLTLWPDLYEWEFIPAAGHSFRDQGSSACR